MMPDKGFFVRNACRIAPFTNNNGMAAMGHVHTGKQDVSSVNLVHNIYPWECAPDTLVT